MCDITFTVNFVFEGEFDFLKEYEIFMWRANNDGTIFPKRHKTFFKICSRKIVSDNSQIVL
jgi:hypothetical protein